MANSLPFCFINPFHRHYHCHWLDSHIHSLVFHGFTTNHFSRLDCQPPAILEDWCFSVSVFSLSWQIPVGNSLCASAWLSWIHVAQGTWRGQAWIKFGRNTRHFLCYVSAHASEWCVFTWPRTPLFFYQPSCFLILSCTCCQIPSDLVLKLGHRMFTLNPDIQDIQ
jgi:hypothetical protein